MPHITTDDGVQLYYEETGQGDPILFLHEFGGHYLSWEPQVRYFSRRYRCITYAARGWPPSDVPDDVAAYSQARAADDAAAVMAALGLAKAHLVGLSMGATAGIEFAIRHPGKALSLAIAAGGGGGSSDPAQKARFQQDCETFAERIEREGMPAMAELYCAGPARVQYRDKDPRGWAEFKQQFADGSATGHALTMLGVQGARQPLFERTAELRRSRIRCWSSSATRTIQRTISPCISRSTCRAAACSSFPRPATRSISRSRPPSMPRCRTSSTPSSATAGPERDAVARQGYAARFRGELDSYFGGSWVILTFSGRTFFRRSV